MVIAIRKEPNGSIYIDKNIREDINYTEPPYNFIVVNINDEYADCTGADFNDNLTFNVEKYNARKEQESKMLRIPEIKARLSELSEDFIQATAGAKFSDLDARLTEFRTLHNELRILLGKTPRLYQ